MPFLKPIYLAGVNKVAVKEGAVSQYLISNSHGTCKCNWAQGAEHLRHSGTTLCFVPSSNPMAGEACVADRAGNQNSLCTSAHLNADKWGLCC